MAFPWLSWCQFCRKTPAECSLTALTDLRSTENLYEIALKFFDEKFNKRSPSLPACPECIAFLTQINDFSSMCTLTFSFYSELRKKCQPEEYEADQRAMDRQKAQGKKRSSVQVTPTPSPAKTPAVRRRGRGRESSPDVSSEEFKIVLPAKVEDTGEIVIDDHQSLEDIKSIPVEYVDVLEDQENEEEGEMEEVILEDVDRVMRNPVVLNKRLKGVNHPCTCPECGEVWSNSDSLSRHMRKHQRTEKPKPFECNVCGKTMATKGALKEHMVIHVDDAPLVCQYCPKRFKNKQRLTLHQDTHTDTVYTCTVCGLVLNTKRTLANHMIVHSDVKNFKCNVCPKEFKRAKALKAHLLSHTGKKLFVCEFCNKQFGNNSNCRTHKRTVHAKELAEQEEEEEERKGRQKKKVPTLNELKMELNQ